MVDIERLPGYELVSAGLADLAAGRVTVEALLVTIGAERLRATGVDVPVLKVPFPPEHRLYEALEQQNPTTAHGRYNALIRRLVSFERALEHARAR